MPPPILKCIDLARFVRVGLMCPVCTGTHCRRSKWHSKKEKLGADGFRPYRCQDCSHRFLARSSAALERILVNCTAGVLLGLGVLVGVELWLDGVDEEKGAPTSTAYSEESTTGEPTRLQTGGEVADVAEAPAAARAQKQQEAAENGDADAMLQLGRDLATGKQRPKERDALVRAMSKEQLQEAHQLSLPTAPLADSSVQDSEFSKKKPALGQSKSPE